MKRHTLLLMLLVPIVATLFINYSAPCYADKYVLEDGDFVDYGYQLWVNSLLVETIVEANAISINFAIDIINPWGLHEKMIGMKNGEEKTIIVQPDKGFLPSDPVYGIYAGEVLEFRNLKIYAINFFPYTDVYTGGISGAGRVILIIVAVILGLGAVGGIGYLIHRYSPKIFGKRCFTCKSLAVGNCRNCGKHFCERCFSNGCPSCKGRSLVRKR